MCAFNSQSLTFLFIEQYGNTLFVKSASGYLDLFEAFVGQSRFETLFLWNFQVEISSDLRPIVEKEISSYKKQTESFSETAL